MSLGSGASAAREIIQFWSQLRLAGLIEGVYSGIARPAGADDAVISTNVPKSRYPCTGWRLRNLDFSGGDPNFYTFNYGNSLIFGIQRTGSSTMSPALSPEDAYVLDAKLDNGLPGAGKVVGIFWNAACTSASPYRITTNSLECPLLFSNVF
ncbi:MAG: hypothetical protein ACOYNL_00070 [Rickettsiales bacterium]